MAWGIDNRMVNQMCTHEVLNCGGPFSEIKAAPPDKPLAVLGTEDHARVPRFHDPSMIRASPMKAM